MYEKSKSRAHISSNTVFVFVECISISFGLMIILNSLAIIEEFMAGNHILVHKILQSPNNSLMSPSILICNPSAPTRLGLVKGGQFVHDALRYHRFINKL